MANRTSQTGGPDFTLTVNGSNFVSNSVVRWEGLDRATTFVSNTQLQAAISAADIATPGNRQVTVFNPAPGGGTSTPLTFASTGFALSVSPASATVRRGQSATFTVTVSPQFGSFNRAVSLACSVQPVQSGAPTCSLSSNSVTPGARPASVTLTVATSTSGALALPLQPPNISLPSTLWVVVLLGVMWLVSDQASVRDTGGRGCPSARAGLWRGRGLPGSVASFAGSVWCWWEDIPAASIGVHYYRQRRFRFRPSLQLGDRLRPAVAAQRLSRLAQQLVPAGRGLSMEICCRVGIRRAAVLRL